MKNLEVAQIIANQVGSKALFMLGAKNLVAVENGLKFQIRGSKKATHIKIVLNSQDLYDVTFYKTSGLRILSEEAVTGVYNDMLNKLIENKTGLYTSL